MISGTMTRFITSLTYEQKETLEELHAITGAPIAYHIRTALDRYFESDAIRSLMSGYVGTNSYVGRS